MDPRGQLLALASAHGYVVADAALAARLDTQDELSSLRLHFAIPRNGDLCGCDTTLVNADEPCIYLCGNSLGLQAKRSRALVLEELDVWARAGVTGHFPDGPAPRPWVSIDDCVTGLSASLVGALPEEVAIMNTLTVNLHLLMVPFYRPTAQRHKILVEAKAFPSDHFAVVSQIRLAGFDPATALIQVRPRVGEHTLREEDVVAAIEEHAGELALVLIGGVHYYTGQLFDIARIATAARMAGAAMGVDLAHAVGNVPLSLHDWDVDFACWCTYKYLNSGPGGIAGAFVHKKHFGSDRLYLQGWWGVELEERFRMDHTANFMPGVRGLQLSNPGVLQTVALLGSLEVFQLTSMAALRAKSVLLTAYLELLLKDVLGKELPGCYEVITPSEPERRGCQLSILFKVDIAEAFQALEKRGVVCDVRKPDVMRVAPVPLYNTFSDVHRFVQYLKDALLATAGAST